MADLDTDVWDVDFSVSKSVRYHSYMRSYWDAADHWNKVLTLISGAAVFVSFLKKVDWLEPWVAAAVVVLSALDIVFGFSDHARAHNSLYRQFCKLAQEIAGTVSPSADDVARWRAQRLAIETEEPGIWEWLNRRCYREEGKARKVNSAIIEGLLKA